MTGQNQGTIGNARDLGAPKQFRQEEFDGHYAFRFSGFTMLNLVFRHLAGLGRLLIDAADLVKGTQRSSITPLQGYAKLKANRYSVEGKIAMEIYGTG
jgi:hypothetical protein